MIKSIFHRRILSTGCTRSARRWLCANASTSSKFASFDANNLSREEEEEEGNDKASNHYDIIINGGGIVGFSLLAAIQSSPSLSRQRVLLIEQQAEPKFSPQSINTEQLRRVFGNRVSAITAGSKQLFEQIGIWNELQSNAKRVEAMQVWRDHYRNAIHFENTYDSSGATCYILENSRIIRALHERISDANQNSQRSDLNVLYSTEVEDVTQTLDARGSTNIELTIKNSSENLRTKLLIGCDGFKSLVRARSDLPYYNFELDQMGIVGTLEVTSPFPANCVAFQRFTVDGSVIALLPLDEEFSSFVLSIGKRDLQSWMSLADEDFVNRLQTELIKEARASPVDRIFAEIGSQFGITSGGGGGIGNPFRARIPPIINAIVPGSRAAFPLGFGTTAPRLVGTIKARSFLARDAGKVSSSGDNFANTVIMGDAAHRVHPLAGQGLNLGLGDAAELAAALERSLRNGFDPFGVTPDCAESLTDALRQFERARVAKLVPMMAAIQAMQTAMSWTPSPLLSIFDSLPWIKSQVVQFANSR